MVANSAVVPTCYQTAVLKSDGLNYMDRGHYDPTSLLIPYFREPLVVHFLHVILRGNLSCVYW
jgi:hypothetical protein